MSMDDKEIKFVSAICPRCKGNLRLDSNLETAFCQYCGAQCIVENVQKKMKKESKLEIVLDFVERQQALYNQDKREQRQKQAEAERKQTEKLRKSWWIYALIFVGLFTLLIVMGILEKQGIM